LLFSILTPTHVDIEKNFLLIINENSIKILYESRIASILH